MTVRRGAHFLCCLRKAYATIRKFATSPATLSGRSPPRQPGLLRGRQAITFDTDLYGGDLGGTIELGKNRALSSNHIVIGDNGYVDYVARLLPGVPVVSEEAASRTHPGAVGGTFLLVDPLDGTRELISGQSEYTVNIAFVRDRTPAAGIIAAPAYKLLWRGLIGHGAERLRMGAEPHITTERTEIRTRARRAQHPVAMTSRFHRDAPTSNFLQRRPELDQVVVGSSLK